jgi:hypothetical protein
MNMKIKSMFVVLLIAVSFGVKASGSLSSMEAMYIYNFLRHVNWPENTGGENFVIGVLEDNDTYQQLVQYTANRKIGTKTIVVKKIMTAEEATTCQLLFVPSSKNSKLGELKSKLGNRPCLIVSEKEGSNEMGSTIEFVFSDNKLKFRINEERAKQQNLVVSKALIDMSV